MYKAGLDKYVMQFLASNVLFAMYMGHFPENTKLFLNI